MKMHSEYSIHSIRNIQGKVRRILLLFVRFWILESSLLQSCRTLGTHTRVSSSNNSNSCNGQCDERTLQAWITTTAITTTKLLRLYCLNHTCSDCYAVMMVIVALFRCSYT